MTNFCEETVGKLNYYNYNIEDIAWIGNRYITVPINEFFDAARRTNYYSGYGSAEMPIDLLIVMKDGSYFERSEYDGSEWWRYVPIIEKPRLHGHLKYRSFNEVDYSYSDPVLGKCVVKK